MSVSQTQKDALERAERKLTAYVGVCTGDKELTEAVLPMVRAALQEPNVTPSGLDPEMGFILDGANKGEWAAYDYAVASHCAAVLDILDGKDTGAGANNEPWATVRKRLLALANQHSAPAAPNLLAYAKCEEARANGEDIAETVLKQYGFDPSRGSATEFMDNMRRAAIAKAQGAELAPSSSPSAVGSGIRRKVGAR